MIGSFYIISRPLKAILNLIINHKNKYVQKKTLSLRKKIKEPVFVDRSLANSTIFDCSPKITIFSRQNNSFQIPKVINNLKILKSKVKNKDNVTTINKDIEKIQTNYEGDKKFMNELFKSNKQFKYLYNVSIENKEMISTITHIIITNNNIYAVSSSSVEIINETILIQNKNALRKLLRGMATDFNIQSCFVSTSNDINGDYTIDSFILNMENDSILSSKVNRIATFLSEFTVPLIND